MNCLYCGTCCKELSPFGNPCKYLKEEGSYNLCSIYEHRPKQCRDHKYPYRHCPVGLQKTGIEDTTKLAMRIDRLL